MASRGVEVTEFTDPICSWAWGTEPKLRLLRRSYGDRLQWRRVTGAIFVGDGRPFDAAGAAPGRIEYWKTVWRHTRMTYPARLRYDVSSTKPACVAVKAAERQGEEVAERVLRRLRESTFVFGVPPDGLESTLDSVRGVMGLDEDRFVKDLGSEDVEGAFEEDWAELRRPNDYVMDLDESPEVGGGRAKHTQGRWRFVTPTLIFQGPAGEATVPGWKPWERYMEALEAVSPGASRSPRPRPTVEEYLATWPTAASTELRFVSGSAEPPVGVVAYDWGDGVFYMTREEAAARGVP